MSSPARPRSSAYVDLPIADFCETPEDALLGRLVASSDFDIELSQRGAWVETFPILRSALSGFTGHLYLEFSIPRLGSRIDAVAVIDSAVIPIEFKVGEERYPSAAMDQVLDYALDLKNFHRGTHHTDVFPILVATAAKGDPVRWGSPYRDGIRPPAKCNGDTLRSAIEAAVAQAGRSTVVAEEWGRYPYQPTPTIVEAARALFAGHSVEAISRSEGGENLTVTSRTVDDVIEDARANGKKAIVFVTGVPGAGKTLVGLTVATQRRDETSATHAVYLSGNGPLVAVLREALTRDEVRRAKAAGKKLTKKEAGQPVKQFIQNVHHFRDDGLRDEANPPHDHIVIFDEAQRAWNQAQTSNFMRRRKGRPGFNQSEPEFLISVMDRHRDWAVIVCLVGGGQEIHTGEAGISAWLEAVRDRFPHWQAYISPDLSESTYAANEAIASLERRAMVSRVESLHLKVSMRSFRAERVSEFVRLVLDRELDQAAELASQLQDRYPIAVTRDLDLARRWVRERARGTERYGLLASSQAMRLKPHAIDIRVNVDPVHWFLNEAHDTRSSWYLEDAATEFQVQGLEVDWAIVTWDADLRHNRAGWSHHEFKGSKWQNIKKQERQQYLLNAYRVLLTRARQGMVIFVPPGDPDDHTRQPSFYNGTARYLTDTVGLVLTPLVN